MLKWISELSVMVTAFQLLFTRIILISISSSIFSSSFSFFCIIYPFSVIILFSAVLFAFSSASSFLLHLKSLFDNFNSFLPLDFSFLFSRNKSVVHLNLHDKRNVKKDEKLTKTFKCIHWPVNSICKTFKGQ